MKGIRVRVLAGVLSLAAAGVAGGEEAPVPELTLRHVHSSHRFSFRTPPDWRVGGATDRPAALEASDGGDLLVRYLFYDGEQGYDSLHVVCMLERLAPEEQQAPNVKYQYDFLSAEVGPFRLLDSAFVVTYLEPVRGHRKWRQRNVTLVGEGLSLCAMSYAPEEVWKDDEGVRSLLDAVLESVEFEGLELEAPAQ